MIERVDKVGLELRLSFRSQQFVGGGLCRTVRMESRIVAMETAAFSTDLFSPLLSWHLPIDAEGHRGAQELPLLVGQVHRETLQWQNGSDRRNPHLIGELLARPEKSSTRFRLPLRAAERPTQLPSLAGLSRCLGLAGWVGRDLPAHCHGVMKCNSCAEQGIKTSGNSLCGADRPVEKSAVDGKSKTGKV